MFAEVAATAVAGATDLAAIAAVVFSAFGFFAMTDLAFVTLSVTATAAGSGGNIQDAARLTRCGSVVMVLSSATASGLLCLPRISFLKLVVGGIAPIQVLSKRANTSDGNPATNSVPLKRIEVPRSGLDRYSIKSPLFGADFGACIRVIRS